MASDQKRAFLAVFLSGIVLFVWQAYFAPKTIEKGNVDVVPPTSVESPVVRDQTGVTNTNTNANPVSEGQAQAKPTLAPSVIEPITDGRSTYSVSNNFSVGNVATENPVFPFKEIVGGETPLKFQYIAAGQVKNLNFVFNRDANSGALIGEDANAGVQLVGSIGENGMLDFVLSSKMPYQYRITLDSTKKELENRRIREYLLYSQEVERISVGSSDSAESKLTWFGIDFNYHLFAVLLNKKTNVKYTSTESGKLVVDTISPENSFSGKIAFAKKEYDHLQKLGGNLHLSVDFGFFGIIAVPILRGLQYFYKYVKNYGWSIIIITIIIRLITMPLYFKSMKSMKKMQQVQPELAKLKEKYKDDPQRFQQETMLLFKKVGANPMGGCLPLVMQMPIFIAFYQVLYNSVELVQAPFMGWIYDLSIKDANYVLPVIMGIAMLLQSKFNPTPTADPTQKKIMYVMPVVFTFIMKDLPAGLNLYMSVSIFFGIAQQLAVNKFSD